VKHKVPFDYLLLVTAASGWIYAAWCLIQLRYERRTPLVWWEPVPFSSTDLTPSGREYHRRFLPVGTRGGLCDPARRRVLRQPLAVMS